MGSIEKQDALVNYAADRFQSENRMTAGCTLKALAKTLALSAPSFVRPLSIAEIVVCGIPVSSDKAC